MEMLEAYILIVAILIAWNVYAKMAIKSLFCAFLKKQMEDFSNKCSDRQSKKRIFNTYITIKKIIHYFSLKDFLYILPLAHAAAVEDQKLAGTPFLDTDVGEKDLQYIKVYEKLAFEVLFACLNLCTVKGIILSLLALIKKIFITIFYALYTKNASKIWELSTRPIMLMFFICSINFGTRDFTQSQQIFSKITASTAQGQILLRKRHA